MTKADIIEAITANTEGLKALKEAQEKANKDQKELLNDHLHEHSRLRFWLFTFLISSLITSNLSSLGLIIYLLVENHVLGG
jgi:hypothetical protein